MQVFLKSFLLLISSCFTLLSLALAINPYSVWKITQSWKAIREPSSGYFMLQRILGVICTIVGLCFLVIFISTI